MFKYGLSADLGLGLRDNERSRWNRWNVKARGVWMPSGHVDVFLAVVQDRWLRTGWHVQAAEHERAERCKMLV